MRVTAGVDIRIDAHGDAGADLTRAGDGVDSLQLALRLGIDRLHAKIDRLDELRLRLADAGEHDLGRNETGAQRDVDLAARVCVDLAAEAPQEPHDRQRRVRLERVVHCMRIGIERIVHRTIARGDRRSTVDVEWRAVRCSGIGKRHAVADE